MQLSRRGAHNVVVVAVFTAIFAVGICFIFVMKGVYVLPFPGDILHDRVRDVVIDDTGLAFHMDYYFFRFAWLLLITIVLLLVSLAVNVYSLLIICKLRESSPGTSGSFAAPDLERANHRVGPIGPSMQVGLMSPRL